MNQLIVTELKQRQTISPTVYQSLKVLQMDTEQLEEYIQDEVLENPTLELDESGNEDRMKSLDAIKEELERSFVPDSLREYSYVGDGDDNRAEDFREDSGYDLREHLAAQFNAALTDEEQLLLYCVIDRLDDNGYLIGDIDEISRVSGFDKEYVGYAIAYIQQMDPLGVGARNISECLLIQLSMLGYKDAALTEMAANHLEDAAAGRYNKIAKKLNISSEQIKENLEIIKSLSPKPASGFGKREALPVYPDLIVRVEDGRPVVSLSERGYPRPYINDYYLKLSRSDEFGEAAEYLNKKLMQARWLLKSIEERKTTILKIAEIIVSHQSEFFVSAGASLRPLTLRQVAAELDVHESTVSRAVSGKYLECKKGSFPLKQFFASASSAGEDCGGEVSRDFVKKRMRELISAENAASPLSDSAIAGILESEGIKVSRRVIAKYRMELGIPGTAVRKRA